MEATLAFVVRNSETGQPIEGAGVILSVGQEGRTNGDGYAAFQVPLGWLSYSVHKAGYQDVFSDPPIEVTGNRDVPVSLVPKFGRISAPPGLDLIRNGERWFGKGATFFLGYDRFLAGEDIRPQLEQLQALGANCVDVWASYWNIAINRGRPPFHVGFRADGLPRLPEFHALLAEYDLYALWVAFADPRLFDKPTSWEVDFWNRFNAALDPIANVCSIILNNEHNAHSFNRVDRSAFQPPPRHVGIASSFTAMKTDEALAYYAVAKWQAGALHHGRKWPTVLKDAVTADHTFQKDINHQSPVWLDEPISADPLAAGDPLQTPDMFARMARIASASACGIVFHSADGKSAQLYGGYTLERARAFFGALT